jgi:hypothetical protein
MRREVVVFDDGINNQWLLRSLGDGISHIKTIT